MSSITFFIIGLILFINPDSVVKFISYCLGGLLILIGLYKTVNYYIHNKNLGVVNQNELAFGITAIVLGIVFIFLASAIELLLRFIVGAWVIIAGLSRIVETFYTTDRSSKFYSLLIVGIILIGLGIYIILVSNLVLSTIGIFMMIYGVIDFVSYFVYRNMFKIVDEELGENVVIEAEVVEDKKKGKKKTSKKGN